MCIVFSQYTLQLCQSVFRDFQSQAVRIVSLAITDEHALCCFFWSFFWHIYASFLHNMTVLRCAIWLFTVKINMPAFSCFYLIASAFPLITLKFSAYKKLWLNIPHYFPYAICYIANPCHSPFPHLSDLLPTASHCWSWIQFHYMKITFYFLSW